MHENWVVSGVLCVFFYVPYYTPTNNTDFELLIQIDLADFTGWISFQLSKFIEEININP